MGDAEEASIVAEVVAAGIGGMFSASALYPLEVIKTKMQAETTTSSSADDDSADALAEGPCRCRGCLAAREARTADGTLPGDDECFQCVHAAGRKVSSKSNGGGGEVEVEVVVMETPAVPPTSAVALARSMYREGGVGAFYDGIETSAVQSATEKSLYFLAYTFLKNGYLKLAGGGHIGTVANLALGCAAEFAHLPVTLPIDCLTTRIQTDDSGAGPVALMSALLSEKGVGGLYNGIQAYAVLCLKPAIQYTVFEQVKRLIILGRRRRRHDDGGASRSISEESLSVAEAFLLGIFARTIATVVVFPYTRAKVMLQSKNADQSKSSSSIPSMLGEMYEREGMAALFRGLGPELTRGVLSTALMMVAKEKISAFVALALRNRRRNRVQSA